jgi:hypothetical protein
MSAPPFEEPAGSIATRTENSLDDSVTGADNR